MRKNKPDDLRAEENNIKITIVYDNNPCKEGLETRWGFACVISGMEKTILFDAGGEGEVLLANMAKMEIEASEIETVLLSHIHDDHTGGLGAFLKKNAQVRVYVPDSFPESFKDKITRMKAEVVEVEKPREILTKIYSTGQMGTEKKEQGLILQTNRGLLIITGCAHPGIVEMVKRAQELFDEPVLLIMGGFHLKATDKDEIEGIIKTLEEMKVKYAGPCHCTGEQARSLFAEQFGEHYIKAGVGKVVNIKGLSSC